MTTAVVISGILGFVLMLFPIVLQKTKRLPFLRQDVGEPFDMARSDRPPSTARHQ